MIELPPADVPDGAGTLKPTGVLARSSTIALGARGAGVAISLLTGIVTARILGPEGKGVLAFLSTASALVVRAGSLGLDGSFAHFYLVRRKPLEDCVGALIWLTAFIGAAAAGLCLGALALQPTLGRGAPLDLSVPFFAAMPAFFTLFVSTFVFFATGRELLFGIFDLGYRSAMLLLFVIVLIGTHGGVRSAVWVQIAVSVIFAALAVVWIGGLVAWRLPFRIGLVRDLLAYGVRYYLYGGFRYALCYGGVLVAGLLLTPRDAGIFSVAIVLGEGLVLFASAINLAFYPSVSTAEDQTSITARTSLHMLWLSAVLAALLSITATWLIPMVYGSKFAASVPAFMLMAPGLVLLGVEQVISSFFAARGMPWRVTIAPGAALILGYFLAASWAPRYGVYGIAVATGAAEIAVAALVIGYFLIERRSTDRPR